MPLTLVLGARLAERVTVLSWFTAQPNLCTLARMNYKDPRDAMLKHSSAILLGLAFLLIGRGATAQTEIQANQSYVGPKRLMSQGVSFEIPTKWQGYIPEGARIFVMGPKSGTAVTIISVEVNTSMAQLEKIMQTTAQLDDTVSIQPVGVLKKSRKGMNREYIIHYNGTPMPGFAYAVYSSKRKVAVLYIMATPEGSGFNVKKQIMALAKSTKFHRLGASGSGSVSASQRGTGNRAFAQRLGGKKLLYMRTTAYGQSRKDYSLCSDGRLITKSRSSMSVSASGSGRTTGYSGSDRNQGQGRWYVDGSTLILQWNDGSKSQFPLSSRLRDSQQRLDNNSHWFLTSQNICR